MEETHFKVVRDPIYGYIGLTKTQIEVINLPVFQRLRRISQLSFAEYVYPNATHNRFSHSLGVMHLARQVVTHLKDKELRIGEQYGLEDDDYQAFMWAALLHDIGHLPFSHVSEMPFAFCIDDEKNWSDYHVKKTGKWILSDEKFQLKEYVEADVLKKVIVLLIGRPQIKSLKLLWEVLHGTASIDRLDYLKRDAYHAGVPEYAILDTTRIISALTYKENCIPIYLDKAKYALEGIIMSYFYMYRAIYYHQKVRAAFRLFQSMLIKAFNNESFKTFCESSLKEPRKFISFDDYQMISQLRCVKDIQDVFDDFINRRFPSILHDPFTSNRGTEAKILAKMENLEILRLEDQVLNAHAGKGVKHLFIDAPRLTAYPSLLYSQDKTIYVLKNDGSDRDLSEEAPYISDINRTMQSQFKPRLYLYPKDIINPTLLNEITKNIESIP